ncbi:glutamate ligase domain-containing protein, partial [Bifidobacterium pseudocatenulatum]
IAHAVGFDFHETTAKEALRNMEPVRIAGRMEHFHDTKSNTIAIVDYAHNYASVTALLDYVDQRYGKDDPEVTLVTGSAGNKAYDRRSEIVRAAQNRVNHLILTFEDTDDEPVEHVCQDMLDSVTNPDLDARIILDRTKAVESTVAIDRKNPNRLHIILIIGKGNERWFKDHGKHIPFEGDDHIVKRIFGLA